MQKASTIDADLIVLDCEDGVAINQKVLIRGWQLFVLNLISYFVSILLQDSARKKIAEMLENAEFPSYRPQWGVRVNSVSSGLCECDLKVVLGASNKPPCILLPKLENIEEILWVTIKTFNKILIYNF